MMAITTNNSISVKPTLRERSSMVSTSRRRSSAWRLLYAACASTFNPISQFGLIVLEYVQQFRPSPSRGQLAALPVAE